MKKLFALLALLTLTGTNVSFVEASGMRGGASKKTAQNTRQRQADQDAADGLQGPSKLSKAPRPSKKQTRHD
jgi:hypothetical protein